jgi:hypothetical protein
MKSERTPTVFLSYSSRDFFFAEMLAIKLQENGFSIWRDAASIRAGNDWAQTIEEGIAKSMATVVALSESSANSAYVTFEWAYAMGMGRPVVPVKLSECQTHPKLAVTQYIDFSYPRALPWNDLIVRLREIDTEADESSKVAVSIPQGSGRLAEFDDAMRQIIAYFNKRGFLMASFERLRHVMNSEWSDKDFEQLIDLYPTVFRRVQLKDGKLGVAKRVP